MHDSFTAIGGLVPMWMMQLGEVVYGGVGSGLYGMLAFVIVAVFIAGLMIGRTPEYLGKKIESYEMKMASLMVLIPVVCVLLGTAIAVWSRWENLLWRIRAPTVSVRSSMLFPRQVIITAALLPVWDEQPVYNIALGLAMLLGRYWLMIPALAIAGALAVKNTYRRQWARCPRIRRFLSSG